MKIALAQLNYIVGDFSNNITKIIDTLNKAENQNVELVVFSELSVCGYAPYDLLEQHDFIMRCQDALQKLAEHCTNIAAIVGIPTVNPSKTGKQLFNSACLLVDGKVQTIRNKSLLPTYDVFDEYRYFQQNNDYQLVEYKGERFALTICEDLWDKQPSAYVNAKGTLYEKSPMSQLNKLEPEYIINIAASPFSYNQGKVRTQVLIENTKRYQLPILYVNQVGANTDLIFDGDSMVINSEGEIVNRLKVFEEDFLVVDTKDLLNDQLQKINEAKTNYIAQIYDALVLGVKDYFMKMGFKTATLGLSGGIDSAVTLAIVADALGSDNVTVLLMPSRFSSDHSIDDAVGLAENLGVKYHTVPIQDIVNEFESSFSEIFKGLDRDVTEENIQARARGTLLMALSNKFGNILLNTSNKSEAAVGYGTLYGDMSGGLSVIGDVYKTDVFKLAWYINRNKEIIPENTITKPPSAELSEDQKDTDSLPEYELLDAILFQYIEQKLAASEIIEQGYDEAVVKKVIRLVDTNEYKRFQTPPVLRVSSKAFGFGRRMPLVARY